MVVLPVELAQELEVVLSDARRLGFLGPGPVDDQIARSLAFATVMGNVPSGLAVDLGSGGGLPGLVLAVLWPKSQWLLVDSNGRRASWLQGAVDQLGISARTEVRCERAELTGRSEHRQMAGLVTARGFGPPGPTAECAAPLLQIGGHLLATDPPIGAAGRWPGDGLAELGLTLELSEATETAAGPVSISRMISVSDCGPRYARRVGVPFKRPLF